jgi:hypothetical protein
MGTSLTEVIDPITWTLVRNSPSVLQIHTTNNSAIKVRYLNNKNYK